MRRWELCLTCREGGILKETRQVQEELVPGAWRELLLLSALVFHGSRIFSKIFLLGNMSEEYILAFSPRPLPPQKIQKNKH